MGQAEWTAVDAYLTDLFAPSDAPLAAALAARAAAGLPPHEVSPPQGKLLQLLVRLCGARRVLELGTLAGYSTMWLARGLPPGGLVVTVESDPARAELARVTLAAAGLADVVDVRVGRALDVLPRLETDGGAPFDLVFLDADKPNNPAYLEQVLRLCRPGSVIVADNVVRGGAVVDASSPDAGVQGVRRFHAMLAAEPRLTATVIQTVGSKGWDGFALALVVA